MKANGARGADEIAAIVARAAIATIARNYHLQKPDRQLRSKQDWYEKQRNVECPDKSPRHSDIRNNDEIRNAGRQIKADSKNKRQPQFVTSRHLRVSFEAPLNLGRELQSCGAAVLTPLRSITDDLAIDKQGRR